MTDTTQREKYSVSVGLNRNLGAELKVAPRDGENEVAMVEHTLEPGRLAAPLHRHTNEDEISYVIEGQMGVQEGDNTLRWSECCERSRYLAYALEPGPRSASIFGNYHSR